jgi:hypothetical protein
MVLVTGVNQDAASKHKCPGWLLRDNGTQKLTAISPRAGYANYSFLFHDGVLLFAWAKPKGSIRELLIKICNEIHSFQMFEACKQTFLVDS